MSCITDPCTFRDGACTMCGEPEPVRGPWGEFVPSRPPTLSVAIAAPAGATIIVMQHHADGSKSVLAQATAPAGDSSLTFSPVDKP